MCNIKWQDITREERHFTSWLYHDIYKDKDVFWDWLSGEIKSRVKLIEVNSLDKQINEIKLEEYKLIDVGYEVCLFRDLNKLSKKRKRIYEIKDSNFINNMKEMPKSKNIDKWTYDIVLFLMKNNTCSTTENIDYDDLKNGVNGAFHYDAIIIIEAKAQQKYKRKQLKDINSSIKIILNLEHKLCDNIVLIGLHSSKKRIQNAESMLNATLTWDFIANSKWIGKNNKSFQIYKRADLIYNK